MSVLVKGAHVEVRRQLTTSWSQFPFSMLTWLPGIELGSPGSCGKRIY